MPDELEVKVENVKDIPDPGAQEGIRKDPRVEQDKLGPESPRFQEVYKNWKDAERRLEKLEAGSKGTDNLAIIEEMRRHNASLEETIKQIGASKDVASDESAIKGLDDKLVELKDLKRQAREKADFDTETKIDDSIADLKLDMRELKKAVEDKKKAPTKPDEKEDNLTDDEREEYSLWMDENEWFTNDTKKRASAVAFEKKVLKEPEFKDATITEVLEEVGKRVEEKFKPVTGTNQVEVGGERMQTTGRPGSIKLSKTEVEVAQGLGIPLETYAKQKSLMKQGGGK
jgi:hypothetical protein